jgi:hypothetical protein
LIQLLCFGLVRHIAPVGDAVGRVVAGDDVLFADLLGHPAQRRHAVLYRAGADAFGLPAAHEVLDVLGAQALRQQVPEAIFVELVRHHSQQPFAVMLRGEGAIAVALAHELEIAVEGAHGRGLSKTVHRSVRLASCQWRRGLVHGVERSGKCFCPPVAPQRDRDYKGRGTPFPVCARLLTARLRCTSLWRCAGLPVGIADAQGPLTQGPRGVRLTHVQEAAI